VVANLATVMAQNSKEVVVVDSDLRRPRIHKIFSLSNRIGLSDYFIRPSDQMAGVMKSSKVKGLSVITSGSLPPNPSELLNTTKMVEVIKKLGTHFDIVILDTPPLLAVTDALVLAPRVDGVILVIDPVKTKRGALRHAIEQLQQVKANLLGVVLNNVRINRSQYYYNRNYYYGKSYGVSDGEPLDPDVRTNVPKSKDTES
jgi:capsular exopolysaccharide synthesis family protein